MSCSEFFQQAAGLYGVGLVAPNHEKLGKLRSMSAPAGPQYVRLKLYDACEVHRSTFDHKREPIHPISQLVQL